MKITLKDLAAKISAELVGDGSIDISGVAAAESAGPSDISFADSKHIAKAASSAAVAVIVAAKSAELPKPQLVVANIDKALIATLHIFAPQLAAPPAGIHPTALIDKTAVISPTASIGPHVVIGPNARVGEKTVLAAGCHVGENTTIGDNCRLDPNVTVYHNCRVGNNVIIQANSTIGSTGFGYSFFDGRHNLIPHNGGVIIEDCVEIGANSCVDRAKFGNTVIGAGSKIDNLVQIAHNVELGKCCLIVAQVGIAGSCRIGNGVVLGGQVGVADHVSVGDGTMIAAHSGVPTDVPGGQKLAGTPPIDIRDALRVALAVQKVPDLIKQVKELSQKVAQLEAAKDNTK
jgi:UDP-3-O-[3-hydroxymyristoyl] glucosamine N-acyltransferase